MSTIKTELQNVDAKTNAASSENSFPRVVVWTRNASRRKRAALCVKRAFDVIAASLLLVPALPIILIIGASVFATSRGGAFFVQERVGKGGRTFRLYKFRTMREGTFDEVMSNRELRAEYEANNFKLTNTDRHITPVGMFLRKTSLDELPQLLNVVLGHMSLVGIRPLVPPELAQRPPFDQVLYVTARPGLTGLWQVGGRSDVTGHDRVALDRSYIEDWGLYADLKILLRTPTAVLRSSRTV